MTADSATPAIPIADPDDPRIAPYRQVRERDVAGRHDGFIAEGTVVLRALARSRLYRARSVLIAEHRLAAHSDLLARFGPETAVYSAAQTVMDAIAGFPIHRGLLAFGRRGPPLPARTLLARAGEGPARVVVLFGIANHDNLGGIFRNAAAFGAAGVLLDPTCCDPLYRKAIRVSAGAALLTPFARLAPGDDAIDLLGAHRFEALAFTPAGREPLAGMAPPPRAAALLGAEGPGLPQSVVVRSRTVAIPMSGGFDSLNVATTSGIVLHHLASSGPLDL